jgi:hypothetical protein
MAVGFAALTGRVSGEPADRSPSLAEPEERMTLVFPARNVVGLASVSGGVATSG